VLNIKVRAYLYGESVKITVCNEKSKLPETCHVSLNKAGLVGGVDKQVGRSSALVCLFVN
jgi:hypothetical protein